MKKKDSTKYIKSFSKGQITIPKEFRVSLGLGDDFWLKISTQNGKIIAEPVDQYHPPKDYADVLMDVDGSWVDSKENTQIRKDIDKRLRDHD
jgi:bifunctional DNA-binding transcriptional regulator/antitoxin component of YhaV-PrlF toxin-antitoxin module